MTGKITNEKEQSSRETTQEVGQVENQSGKTCNNKKSVSFGLHYTATAEIVSDDEADSLQEQSPKNSLAYRRPSQNKPSFAPGSFRDVQASVAPLDFKSVIPPPVPESLPTTPGFELQAGSYFDQASLNAHLVPPQQIRIHPFNEDSTTEDFEVETAKSGMTFTNPMKSRWRVISLLLWVFNSGLTDGAPGAILPRVEKYYGINYSIVSLIWMSNAVGFIMIALLSHKC
ncbi:unnamed protein product [Ambrosiozyma monospora]|uniref:Unnamed protein product n=1 Tax=Ambrosiozyma monospora TaxID=43982 RepID=A0A9W6Z4D1_AMBMO|nr:unnamed protein product [Ambrosiozyma monospora]